MQDRHQKNRTIIFAHLHHNWLARRGNGNVTSPQTSHVRGLRIRFLYSDHRPLCPLHVATRVSHDLMHHLIHRYNLMKCHTRRKRVGVALSHFRFEQAFFNEEYKQAVYDAGGLALWKHASDGNRFVIRLHAASRIGVEGDLTIALMADGKCLHRLSFTWVEGSTVGASVPIVPFVVYNQGRWTDAGEAFKAFERGFPNNSPSFFCFSALQGVAQAVSIPQIVGVGCHARVNCDPEEVKQYDNLWRILGGAKTLCAGFLIALPFYLKPLAEIPAKHRNRTVLRRKQWHAISDSARSKLKHHLLRAPE